ncbi:MAG TPA: alpha/beta hydrolase [Pyrinomonadaceae bacterium]|nr:alpha/beta hydrolase [Pyrinomonadaceae bacterium]
MNEDLLSDITFDFAQVGGVRLHYAQAGTGEKLVLLLHGFPEFWYSWRHQLAALGDHYTVIAPDLRGYNLSSKPANVADYEIDRLVDDVLGLIRYFGHEQAAIVGHDWGALVAWAVAQKHPEAVWKLAALQVPPPAAWRKNQTFKQLLASWYMFLFQIPALPEWLLGLNDFALLERALKTTTAASGVFSERDIAEYKKSWREGASLTPALNYYRANILKRMFSTSAGDEKVSVPTLFIYGEKDSAVLPESVKGVQEFVDAQFTEVRIPNAGHWVQQEAAVEVNNFLSEFLAD